MTSVAIVHDYLTQRGGAERVVLSMHRAFPNAPIYTALYESRATFPEFASADIRVSPLNRAPILRRHHRLALPLLAPTFNRQRIDVDVLLCSSSGWAHGAQTTGTKIVYFYTPARWLYQTERYLGERSRAAVVALRVMRPYLVRWDKRAAASADISLTQSRVVVERLQQEYGIDAELLPPPPGIDPSGLHEALDNIQPGFFLCVSRLLPYKNVAGVVEAFASLPGERLVVVGGGPESSRLQEAAPANVCFVGSISDAKLRWLYNSSVANVSASFEDFGLTPLEAASFGKPSAVLRAGGFLDTVVEGETGEFFDSPTPQEIAESIRRVRGCQWSTAALTAHADRYSEERFVERLREVVERSRV